ncbi:hypothetical protein R1flu_012748 [Riccia fluitans]|uniref:Uncharacterized protein n=1 Tax=Riccia fluitans TaxID=41844 RepID=A0ABD1ZBM4_9MARC
MTKLKLIGLGWNALTEIISELFGNLVHLTDLKLQLNSFDGSILESIGNLTKLTNLNLGLNMFQGMILRTICSSWKLTSLDLKSKFLCGSFLFQSYVIKGSLPNDPGELAQLRDIDFSCNSLTGFVSSLGLGKTSQVLYLNLSATLITGGVPIEVASLPKLVTLDLSANELGGEIPPSLGNVVTLSYIDLSATRVMGALPKSLGSLVSLKHLGSFHEPPICSYSG